MTQYSGKYSLSSADGPKDQKSINLNSQLRKQLVQKNSKDKSCCSMYLMTMKKCPVKVLLAEQHWIVLFPSFHSAICLCNPLSHNCMESLQSNSNSYQPFCFEEHFQHSIGQSITEYLMVCSSHCSSPNCFNLVENNYHIVLLAGSQVQIVRMRVQVMSQAAPFQSLRGLTNSY